MECINQLYNIGCKWRYKQIRYDKCHQKQNEERLCCDAPDCKKIYSSWYLLQRHRSKHNKNTEKPFDCDWNGCKLKFKKLRALIIHRRLHTGDTPYKCVHEDCNKSFSSAKVLKTHLKKHLKNNFKSDAITCCVTYCNNNGISNQNIIFHRFPTTSNKSILRCEAWVDYCANDMITKLFNTKQYSLLKRMYICSEHFEDFYYSNPNTKKNLLTIAVPTKSTKSNQFNINANKKLKTELKIQIDSKNIFDNSVDSDQFNESENLSP